jgi:hypothetical protein
VVGEKGEEFVGGLQGAVYNHYPKFDAVGAYIVRPVRFCYSEPALELRDQKSEVRGQLAAGRSLSVISYSLFGRSVAMRCSNDFYAFYGFYDFYELTN